MSNNCYLDVTLTFPNDKKRVVEDVYFKRHIIKAINQVFGEVASCLPVDLVRYSAVERRGIIRVPSSNFVKVRSSLTLSGSYEGGAVCYFEINKVCDSSLSLIGESRNFEFI